jgi:hypothetical protein
MYCWKECLSLSCPATSYSDVLTIVARIRFLPTMTFVYCCAFEHAYRAVAWQRFGQIRYNMYLNLRRNCSLALITQIFFDNYYSSVVHFVNGYNNRLLPLLRQFFLIPNIVPKSMETHMQPSLEVSSRYTRLRCPDGSYLR